MSPNERLVVALASAAHAMDHGLELTYAAVLLSIQAEFGTGLLLLGFIANLMSLGFGLMALPAGLLADRLGSRRVVALSMAGAGLSALAVSASPTVPLLAGTLVAMGLSMGLYHPAGLAFIGRSVRGRSMAMGYHGMAGNLGTALAPAGAAALASLYSWRLAFLVMGLLCLAVGVSALASRVREGGVGPATPATNAPGQAAAQALPLPRVVALLSALFGVGVFSALVYRGVFTFLPTHLKEQADVNLFGIAPLARAGSFTTLALLFGVAGQYAGGWIGERFRRERLLAPLMLGLPPALVLAGLARGWALVASASLFTFFFFLAQPVQTSLVADYTSARLQGRVYGLFFLLNATLGSFGGTLAGYLAERFGTEAVFLGFTGFALVALGLAGLVVVLAGRAWREGGYRWPRPTP